MKKKAVIHFKGRGVAGLREKLNEFVLRGQEVWPVVEPLPTTRELGSCFGISNVSAHRLMAEFVAKGRLWRAANGRYYLTAARRLLEKPNPLACLLRRLESWTEVGRMIMQGADEACGAMDRALLLFHDKILFRQTDALSPPLTGSHLELKQSLEDFLNLHGERTSGVLLDELWPDEVLKAFQSRLRKAVVLYRSTNLDFVGNVTINHSRAAGLIMERAVAGGCRSLHILNPVNDYAPANEMTHAIQQAAKGAGLLVQLSSFPCPESARKGLVTGGRKTLWVVTEDNLALEARNFLNTARAGRDKPLCISTMGSPVATRNGIPCLATDYRRLGFEAARMAMEGRRDTVLLDPVYRPGEG